jgi:hypothetical protein
MIVLQSELDRTALMRVPDHVAQDGASPCSDESTSSRPGYVAIRQAIAQSVAASAPLGIPILVLAALWAGAANGAWIAYLAALIALLSARPPREPTRRLLQPRLQATGDRAETC